MKDSEDVVGSRGFVKALSLWMQYTDDMTEAQQIDELLYMCVCLDIAKKEVVECVKKHKSFKKS